MEDNGGRQTDINTQVYYMLYDIDSILGNNLFVHSNPTPSNDLNFSMSATDIVGDHQGVVLTSLLKDGAPLFLISQLYLDAVHK